MRKTVFLSSTGKDLADWRAQIITDARGYDWFRLDAMEEWGARSHPPIELCRRRVAEADMLAGLIGHYRGWEPDGDAARRSITEMEYDWAVAGGKARLMFVAPDGFAGAASDGEPGARQRDFRARLLSAETVDQRCFGSAHALSTAVFKAIVNDIIGSLAEAALAPPANEPGQPSDAARAVAAFADTAAEENLSVEELQARGRPLDEIEAILQKRKRDAVARMAQHRDAEAEARKDAAAASKRLGALAFLYDTAKALAAYAEAAQLDPEDWEALWRLGYLQLKRAGDLAGAKRSFERLIALHPTVDDPYYIHWSHLLLGDVEAALGNRSPALDQYERGQALVQDLIARDPDNPTWQRDLSVSYNNIGDIRAARGDRDGALKAYEDGLDIAKRLAERDKNNAEWQRDLSVSYNKIGDIRAARGDRDGALKAYEDGLDIRKRLAERDKNNAEWQRDLSVVYNKIGDIRAARGDRDGALKAYEDGLDIAKRLAERDKNNAEWQRDLSVVYNKIGDIRAARGDRDGALKAYEDGLDIAKRLAERDKNNAEWQRDLSVSYNKIGDIRAARGDRDGALKAYEDGLDIAKRLAERDKNNAEWQRDLSVSYDRVGDIRAARGDSDGALKAYEDGLDIAKRLAERDKNNAEWQRDLSVSYDRVGDIRAARGDSDGALKAYEDGLDIRKRLAERDKNNVQWQTDLAVSAWKLAAAGAEDGRAQIAGGLAILKRLDAEGKLTADQKGWIGAFDGALRAPAKKKAAPWWKVWAKE